MFEGKGIIILIIIVVIVIALVMAKKSKQSVSSETSEMDLEASEESAVGGFESMDESPIMDM